MLIELKKQFKRHLQQSQYVLSLLNKSRHPQVPLYYLVQLGLVPDETTSKDKYKCETTGANLGACVVEV